MELLAVCLNPFQLCMGPPDRSEEQQQQQSPTQRTRLLQFPVIECEVTQREAKALAVLLLDAEGDMVSWSRIHERGSSLYPSTVQIRFGGERLRRRVRKGELTAHQDAQLPLYQR